MNCITLPFKSFFNEKPSEMISGIRYSIALLLLLSHIFIYAQPGQSFIRPEHLQC